MDWESRFSNDDTPWERDEINPACRHWLSSGYFDAVQRLLVPGGGRSPEPALLAAEQIEVSVIDGAASAVAYQDGIATAQDLPMRAIKADLLSWQPSAPVDAIYEQTCLCALNPEQWPRYVQQLADWLQPGGYLFALFMQTNEDGGPPWHCALERMRELFAEPDWHWPQAEPIRVPHPSGVHELGVILQRNTRSHDHA